MIVAYITLTLTGSVRILRESKSLSQQDINKRLAEAKADSQVGCQFCYLPASVKNHDVAIQEQKCVQRINVTEKQYKAIMAGESLPSRNVLQANNLVIKTKQGWVFQSKKWNAMHESQRLWLFYRDHAMDMNATSHEVHIVS
jgi:hypothetical protein